MSDKSTADDLFGAEREDRGSGDEFLIVGIGASAGGIKALKEFFSRVPADSDMAYVVILHLSPNHESRLAEILQTTAAIPVTQVLDRVKVKPNNVYVISPNQSLSMLDGYLALSEMTRIEERRAPVDIFFRTLGESHHSRAVCVILSGSGANGSMGMKRVKEYGGVCIAQDPTEAEYSDMPRNSIATGLVDYILPVSQIPEKIIAYKDHLGSVNIPLEKKDRHETDEVALRDIFTQLRLRTGHDFANYKRTTVLRRIERRISVHELPDLPSYAKFLRETLDESQALLKDLLISVTSFFRDPEPFKAIETNILPKLLEEKGGEDHVRIWVAGCATGEEAYSIAMLFAEAVGDGVDKPSVQVFATDIDEWAISKARDGFYTLNDAADVSPERLRTFFTKEANGYRVRRELREKVLFAGHNLIKDAPFSHLDLITCRNLLIYLNRSAQRRIMEVLHFSLNPGGYLFLGTSESIEGSTDLFSAVDKEHHIYQSRPVDAHLPLTFPSLTPDSYLAAFRSSDDTVQVARVHERLSYLDLHQRLLEEYASPSVLINEDYEIMHLSERAGRYLHVAGGELSNNLLKMVRPELRLELTTALYQAVHNRRSIEASNLSLVIDGREERVKLIVRPVLRHEDPKRGFILVLFDESEPGSESTSGVERVLPPAEPIARQLEDELMHVRAQLRATVEQHDLQQEELKASNEELQAMNEELRSAAEELETSREELQSLNEELTTVNQELKTKIEELSQSNNDFRNLMNSTEIGTIFLDRSMKVKLFTPPARIIFNLIPSDIGRPLSDITNKLDDARLIPDVERVLETLVSVEREVSTPHHRRYQMRILPYRTADDRINGVVLTFADTTVRHQAEAVLHANDMVVRGDLEKRVNARTLELAEANEAMRKEVHERKQSEEVRVQLLQQLVGAQEDERRRIARDLHDEMGQQLTALRLQLENLKNRLKNDKQAAAEVDHSQEVVRKIEMDIDFLAWQLRPAALDDIGLRESLTDYVKSWSKHINRTAEFHSSGLDHRRLPPEMETNLYRIAQEALNNVAKHSNGDRVDIILELREHHVVLVIEDNGTGFDPEAKSHGMGLYGIRERTTLIGGKLEIESAPGKGTTLFVRVPMMSQ